MDEAELKYIIDRYVQALNWLQFNVFEQHAIAGSHQMGYRLAPSAAEIVAKLRGDSIFGAALTASDAGGNMKQL